MSVREKHPQYVAGIDEMVIVRDCFEGEGTIKARDTVYLPPTAGQVIDGKGTANAKSKGALDYKAYKQRAIFHDFVSDAVDDAIGLMHRKPATIELPDGMEDIRENATLNGESLQDLLKNINVGQLIEGRVGLLADMPMNPKDDRQDLPYIAMYNGTAITNWDDSAQDELDLGALSLVILNESGCVRQDDFSWEIVEKYRVLLFGNFETGEEGDVVGASYRVAVVEPSADDVTSMQSLAASALIEPSIRGNLLEEIPFVFINSKDINPDVDKSPLIGLSRLALAVYRAEADYQQNLYMQAQETFVTIGSKKGGKKDAQGNETQIRTGAGASLALGEGGDAKYVGVSAAGLGEQRQALEANKSRADGKAGKLLDTTSKAKESNDALETRIAAGTTDLVQIAQAGAKGLEKQLKQIARWMGLDDDEVKVTPNIDFEDVKLAAAELEAFMKAKLLGAPISLETIHRIMSDRELTAMTFEDEMALAESEFVDNPAGVGTTGEPSDQS